MNEQLKLNLVRAYGNILDSSTLDSFVNNDCVLSEINEVKWQHNSLKGYKISMEEE